MDRLVTCFFFGLATSAALHFTSAVHFNVQPRDTTVMTGETVILQCALDEMLLIGENHHWIWTNAITQQNVTLSSNRQIIKTGISSNLSRRLSIIGNKMHAEYNLRIESVTKSEQGMYRCMLHIRQSQEFLYSKAATLKVESMLDRVPVCKLTPYNPLPGTHIIMTCIAGSRFSKEIAWMIGNTRLQSNIFRQGGILTAVLRRTIYEQDNFNTFTCIEGKHSSIGIIPNVGKCSLTPLMVQTRVEIIPSFVRLNEYKDTTLQCIAESLPAPTFYEWFIDELLVLNSPDKLLLMDKNRQLIIKALYLQTINKNDIEIKCSVGNIKTVKSTSIQLQLVFKKKTSTLKPFTTVDLKRTTSRSVNNELFTVTYNTKYTEDKLSTLIPTLPSDSFSKKMFQDVAIISASVLGTIIIILVISIVFISTLKKNRRRLLEISNYNTVAEEPLSFKKVNQCDIVTPRRMKYCHKAGSCNTLQPPLPDRERYTSKQRRQISEHYNASCNMVSVTPERKSEYFRKISGGSRGEGDGCSIGEEAQKSISHYENAIAIRLSYLNDYSKRRYQRISSQRSYDDVEQLALYNNISESIYEVS